LDHDFENERCENRRLLRDDAGLKELGDNFLVQSGVARYSYNFDWLGLPIIQYPADIVAIQELIWRVGPGAVVETGIARGGSLALSASILELLGGDGIIVGIDIDLRESNRSAIEAHRLAHRIRLVDGSSIDPSVVGRVHELIGARRPVLVFLDSMHTHDHVLAELDAYAPLVEPGSYLVVFDTSVELAPEGYFPDRPWGKGNSPLSAVKEFLARPGCRFEVDEEYDSKLLISVAGGGYLRCVR